MMHPDVFDQKVRELRQRSPFQPFVIDLAGGGRLVVGEMKAIAYPFAGQSVYFPHDDAIQFVDCETVVRIVELVPAESA